MPRTLVSLCALLLFAVGCRGKNEAQAVGKYSTGESCIEVTLRVNSDHTFLQKVTAKKIEINRLSGAWSLDKKTGFIHFKPFLDFLSDFHGREVGGFSAPVEGLGSTVELGPVMVKCPDSLGEMNYVKTGF
jgi:hypothetical protein